jgi:hypothetical protein
MHSNLSREILSRSADAPYVVGALGREKIKEIAARVRHAQIVLILAGKGPECRKAIKVSGKRKFPRLCISTIPGTRSCCGMPRYTVRRIYRNQIHTIFELAGTRWRPCAGGACDPRRYNILHTPWPQPPSSPPTTALPQTRPHPCTYMGRRIRTPSSRATV